MSEYIGLDVSLKETAISIRREGKGDYVVYKPNRMG